MGLGEDEVMPPLTYPGKILPMLASFYLFFIAILSPSYAQPEGISAVDWNGSEFLIGAFNGNLVRYDGKEFLKIGTLKERILGIDHTSDFWLINAWKSLAKYDGEKLVELAEYDISKISCNPEYCLIHARVSGEKLTPEEVIEEKKKLLNMSEKEKEALFREKEKKNRLLRYDGENLTVLKSEIEFPVREMHWNGREWRILAGDYVYGYDENLLRFVRYEGPEIIKTGRFLKATSMAWNGKEWILTGRLSILNKTAPVISYSNIIREIPSTLTEDDEPGRIPSPTKITCNQEYCLIFLDNNDILRFDGAFKKVNTSFKNWKGFYGLREAKWNGEHWLLSYSLVDCGGAVAKYDSEFEELEGPSNSIAGGFDWSGEHWLIGTFGWGEGYPCRWALYKYDGRAFQDLTGEFKEAMAKESEEARQPQKAVCGPIGVLLIALLPAFICRKRGWRG